MTEYTDDRCPTCGEERGACPCGMEADLAELAREKELPPEDLESLRAHRDMLEAAEFEQRAWRLASWARHRARQSLLDTMHPQEDLRTLYPALPGCGAWTDVTVGDTRYRVTVEEIGDGKVGCGHREFGSSGRCGEMICANYVNKHRESA